MLCGIFAVSWMALRPIRHTRPYNIRTAQEVQSMGRMKRGVGYCGETECEDYAKGVFLLNHGDTFYCPRCRVLGKVEKVSPWSSWSPRACPKRKLRTF